MDQLDALVARAHEIKGVAGENLRKALDWLPMGRKLVTVATDCDLSGHVEGWPSLASLALTDTDRDKYCVRRILDFYERHQVDYADYFFAAWRFRR